MESVLLNGSYAVCDAEKLVREFYKVKEAFQLSKIDIANATEEDIKHSESKVRELGEEVRQVMRYIKNGHPRHIGLHAKLVVEFYPDGQ